MSWIYSIILGNWDRGAAFMCGLPFSRMSALGIVPRNCMLDRDRNLASQFEKLGHELPWWILYRYPTEVTWIRLCEAVLTYYERLFLQGFWLFSAYPELVCASVVKV